MFACFLIYGALGKNVEKLLQKLHTFKGNGNFLIF